MFCPLLFDDLLLCALSHLVSQPPQRSTSTLLLIRSTQEISSELVPILTPLVKLFNNNSACARTLMVAQCGSAPLVVDNKDTAVTRDLNTKHPNCIMYESSYYESQQLYEHSFEKEDEDEQERPLTPPQSLDNANDRLLIFTTGDKTFTPHQIGMLDWVLSLIFIPDLRLLQNSLFRAIQ